MPLFALGRESAADGVAAVAVRASLHTGDPGSAGTANEVTGGGYSRQNLTYPADTTDDGSVTSATARFELTNVKITHFALWTATGGCVGAEPLNATQEFTTAGSYDLTVIIGG